MLLEAEKTDAGIWNSLYNIGWNELLYIELQWRAIPNWQDLYPNWLRIYRNLRRAFHRTPDYQEFRTSILERDGCCTNAKCEATSRLQIHHVKSWYSHPGLRLDPKNCRTLCSRCHRDEDSSKRWYEGGH